MSTTHPSSIAVPTKATVRKPPFTFGDFVAGSYRVWGKRKALGIIRLAAKSRMIVFCGQQRIVIS